MTELIIAILALVKCELDVVQSSLLGSILSYAARPPLFTRPTLKPVAPILCSNLLLVLGMTFFVGGVRFSEQGFSTVAAQLNSSLLMMSVVAILIPAGFVSRTFFAVIESAMVLTVSCRCFAACCV